MFDIGSFSTRAGYAGEDMPKVSPGPLSELLLADIGSRIVYLLN